MNEGTGVVRKDSVEKASVGENMELAALTWNVRRSGIGDGAGPWPWQGTGLGEEGARLQESSLGKEVGKMAGRLGQGPKVNVLDAKLGVVFLLQLVRTTSWECFEQGRKTVLGRFWY